MRFGITEEKNLTFINMHRNSLCHLRLNGASINPYM
jgi:hypothetical protein